MRPLSPFLSITTACALLAAGGAAGQPAPSKPARGGAPHDAHHGPQKPGSDHGAGHAPRHGGRPVEVTPGALKVGDRVPDFTLTELNGRARKLSELRKQTKSGVVSLTFWCSFCHSCRGVEGKLDQFAAAQKDQATVAAVDASAGETADGVKRFAEQRGLGLPIYLDAPGRTADLFGVRVTTTTVIIDGKGILRYRGRFAVGEDDAAGTALRAMLAGKPVPVKETPLQG